jgi:hypothetical protein
MKCEYTLRPGETIVCAASHYAARRLKVAVGRNRILRLVPSKPQMCAYFVIEKSVWRSLPELHNVRQRDTLAPAHFESIVDETNYTKKQLKQQTASQI